MSGNIRQKLDVELTLVLSFGFFGSSLVWSIYNAYVPIILANNFILSTFTVGIVMSIDNVFGVVFQPLFGSLSDRTRTRFGRRLPYLFVCMPICAVLFVILPHMSYLWAFMGVAILFTFVMSIWRTPAVSLMPDLTPGPFQSQGNGIVNLMGGVGAVLAFAGGGFLYRFGGISLPFLVAGILLILSMIMVAVFVREPKHLPHVEKKDKTPFSVAAKEFLSAPKNKSLILLLFAIFFWFMGYNAVETFFTLYATNRLNMDAGMASITLSAFALALVVFAIPAGIIGARFGRRKTILVGLVGVTCIFIPFIFISSGIIAMALMIVGGMFWACVNINSLPMITRMSGPIKIGKFIGYYYLFSFLAQTITAPIFGAIRDAVGHYQSLFIYAAIAFVLAFLCLIFVRHGESNDTDEASADDADIESLRTQ